MFYPISFYWNLCILILNRSYFSHLPKYVILIYKLNLNCNILSYKEI